MHTEDSPPTFWTSLLHDVASLLASTESAERRIDRVLTRMQEVLLFDRAALWEVSPIIDRPITIMPEPSSGQEHTALASRLADLARLLSGASLPGQPDARPDANTGVRPRQAYLAVPLIGIGEIIGMLYIERFSGSFDETHLALLSGVAAQLGAYLTVLRAERALRESEKKFRKIYESGMFGIALLDAAGVVTEANEPALRMLGTTREELARGTGQGPHGAEALRISEARFARIISIAADAIITIDEQRRILLYNEGAQQIFGHARDDILGKPLDMLLPERFRAVHRRHIRSFAKAPAKSRLMGELNSPIFGLRKSGEEFPVEAAISKLESGGASFFTVVLRDITEQKRIEHEQRFLAEAGAILASTLDHEETLTSIATLAVREIADCCVVDVIDTMNDMDVMGEGTRVQRLEVAHADPAKAGLAKALQQTQFDGQRPYFARPVIETGQPLLMTKIPAGYLEAMAQSAEHLAALRELSPQSFMALPLLAQGRCLGALIFVSTRPSRRYGPQDLPLAEKLARRAALAVNSARLYRTARQAIRARDEVLGIVAHDLRNPLSTIKLSAALLQDQLAQDGMQAQHKAIDAILRASRRADRLIQDLVDMTKLEARQLVLAPARVSAAQLVGEGIAGQRALAVRASVELRADLPQEDPIIWADGERLLQVLENLIGNALKFTPPGGRITLGVEPGEGEALFRVEDTGCGIPPEHLSRIFDRFWQAQQADSHGAGLGLTICKGIVEAHGGRIRAESTIGSGTTILFTIPMAPPLPGV